MLSAVSMMHFETSNRLMVSNGSSETLGRRLRKILKGYSEASELIEGEDLLELKLAFKEEEKGNAKLRARLLPL